MSEIKTEEKSETREKVKIITFDAAKVPDFETYTKLLKSGELKKYIIGEKEG